MNKEKVWVWFKRGIKGGQWVSGFLASSCEEEGVLIEKSDFVNCRVPEWRIRIKEPGDINEGPEIPKDAIWKY